MGKTKIELSPAYSLCLRYYEKRKAGEKLSYNDVAKKVQDTDPTITSSNIAVFFNKLDLQLNPQLEVQRNILRIKKKQIAHDALDEVLEEPTKLSMRDRIALGREASVEEIQEEEFDFKRRMTEKSSTMLEKLLNAAIYGRLDVVDGDSIPANHLLEEGEYESVNDSKKDS